MAAASYKVSVVECGDVEDGGFRDDWAVIDYNVEIDNSLELENCYRGLAVVDYDEVKDGSFGDDWTVIDYSVKIDNSLELDNCYYGLAVIEYGEAGYGEAKCEMTKNPVESYETRLALQDQYWKGFEKGIKEGMKACMIPHCALCTEILDPLDASCLP